MWINMRNGKPEYKKWLKKNEAYLAGNAEVERESEVDNIEEELLKQSIVLIEIQKDVKQLGIY